MRRLTRQQLVDRYEPVISDIMREGGDHSKETVIQLFAQFLIMARRHDLILPGIYETLMSGALDPLTIHPLPLNQWFGDDPINAHQDREHATAPLGPEQIDSGILDGRTFYNSDTIQPVRALRAQENYDEAEALLRAADPTPIVLNELRMILSKRAWAAKKEKDWPAVVRYLAEYERLADEWREWCLQTGYEGPRPHTPKDQALLVDARAQVGQGA